MNGDSIRVYTETQSFGHTWISVGEGSNMTVYIYEATDLVGHQTNRGKI